MRTEILVTGGGGLLGHALRQICPQATYLTSRHYDLRDPCEVGRLFDEHEPRRILHLAARVGGIKVNAEKNADLFADNVKINTNVLSEAHRRGVSRLVSVLSSCAFPVLAERPASEEDLHLGLPYVGNLGYGYAKRMLDLQTKLLWEQHRSQFSTLTPVTLFGPHDNWDLEEAHVLAALIHKCLFAKQQDRPLEVWGSGDAVRQFVFVQDVARLLLWELDHFVAPTTVIVAADTGLTIRALAHRIAEAMDFRGPMVFDTSKPEGQRVRVMKSAQFATRFPDFVFTSFEEGLKITVQWFEQHYHRRFAESEVI